MICPRQELNLRPFESNITRFHSYNFSIIYINQKKFENVVNNTAIGVVVMTVNYFSFTTIPVGGHAVYNTSILRI